MAEDSQFAQATQQFSFQDFLERMKEPAAADLVRYIKTYDAVYCMCKGFLPITCYINHDP